MVKYQFQCNNPKISQKPASVSSTIRSKTIGFNNNKNHILGKNHGSRIKKMADATKKKLNKSIDKSSRPTKELPIVP